MTNGTISTLKDKLIIKGTLTLINGMHIGASSDFAPIGAVDSVVVRDPLTKKPIIPGSSLKGKMRTLLAKAESKSPVLEEHNKDSAEIKRLFGTSDKPIFQSRLQFSDLFMSDHSKEAMKEKTDLYLTEIKFENTINRLSSVANPRQIERVPAGAEFELRIVYNLENSRKNSDEVFIDDSAVKNDFENISKAFKLLQLDYIGGHGSRGYGKVKISDLTVEAMNVRGDKDKYDVSKLELDLKEAEGFGL